MSAATDLRGLDRVKMRDLEAVVHAACQVHHVTVEEVFSRHNYRPIPAARATIARAFREMGFGLTEIGRLLHRDHTSVMAMLKRCPAVPAAPQAAEERVAS